MKSHLEIAFEKKFAEGCNHLEELFKQPEEKWFYPTNINDLYKICSELHEYNLIAKKVIPTYNNGNFTGNKIYFKYTKSLNFKS